MNFTLSAKSQLKIGVSMSLFELDNIDSWQEKIHPEQQKQATVALENGQVVFLPHLNFSITSAEKPLLSAEIIDPKRKNISFNPTTNQLGGYNCSARHEKHLQSLLQRYSYNTQHFVSQLFPSYQSHLQLGRTSLRCAEIADRTSSAKKDDKRLHVDAFPSQPLGKQRILRIFTNINIENEARHWYVGESFPDVAERFFKKSSSPWIGSQWLLERLGITKCKRSDYDHFMLQIHDRMKCDIQYQQQVKKTPIAFPVGSSWLVFTDSVSHAALKGRQLLEQTFYLPYQAMLDPQLAPQAILEQLANKPLL